MRKLLLIGWVLTVLIGCSSVPPKAGRTLVGTWDVAGARDPIKQTFKDDGQFTSEAETELPVAGGEKAKAVIVSSGSYKYDGRKLYTTIAEIDVTGAPEDVRENLVKNSRENVGQSHSAVIEWKSDDELTARQPRGVVLLYKRKK